VYKRQTQYKSLSLNRHIRRAWSMLSEELGEFIEILPPQKRVGNDWYLGTADAVFQNLYSIEWERPRHVVVLAGDHVYKMDYEKMVRFHIEKGAGLTIAGIEVPRGDASRFGVLQIDDHQRVMGFQEKPEQPAAIPGAEDLSLASMGIYVFDTNVLVKALREDHLRKTTHDFGNDIIPAMVKAGTVPVLTYRFHDENRKAAKYWRDIGTLDAFYEANMDLVHVDPEFNLYDTSWPVRTYQPQAPPAKFVFGQEGTRCGYAVDSIISPGCIISGSGITGSILSPNVRVHSFCTIENSILMPGVNVNRHARIRNAIIDRDVEIPRAAVIGYDTKEDHLRHTVSEGGVVVVSFGESPLVGAVSEESLAREKASDTRR
jgi:glucose-1-phosphate adenylyltransferase